MRITTWASAEAKIATIDKLALELAADMIEQNPMLDLVNDKADPRDAGIGVFDFYDNKFYDMRRLARIAYGEKP